MTRTEERLTEALGAAASRVQEGSLRPLTAGEGGPRRPGWLRAPVAAAVGVALVIGLAVLAAQVSGRNAASGLRAPRHTALLRADRRGRRPPGGPVHRQRRGDRHGPGPGQQRPRL